MILTVNICETLMADFFRQNGYSVKVFKKGLWIPAYHNGSEWWEYEVPGIEVDGKLIEAKPVFEEFVNSRINRFLLPKSPAVRMEIDRIIANKKT